jgi:uncharacterized protein YgbK (DUF1537 family)
MPILYTFYGDDFTGSTDVLEQLGSNGIGAVLFLGAPAAEHLAAFPDVEAIGIAGDSRSRSAEWMSANLGAMFQVLKRFGAPVTHYKTCSTFDSSPTCGSIGRAMEVGRQIFSPVVVPIVVGAPHLGRYVAFGNLFATDADGLVRRIDRHPMSLHPVTPMHEADLRVHLAAQTSMRIGLIDFVALLSGGGPEAGEALIASGHAAILFDTIDSVSQLNAGLNIWKHSRTQPIFCAGSSGLTAALIAAWRTLGMLNDVPPREPLAGSSPILAISGSCSEKTRRQLEYAFAHGYRGIALDPEALLDRGGVAYNLALRAAAESLSQGRDTVLYTALGPASGASPGSDLGVALGSLLRQLLSGTARSSQPVRRVVICGGDTSSHAVQQLELYALSWLANLRPGVPLCRGHADGELDGLEVVLKGGQVGGDDFFQVVRGGKAKFVG